MLFYGTGKSLEIERLQKNIKTKIMIKVYNQTAVQHFNSLRQKVELQSGGSVVLLNG